MDILRDEPKSLALRVARWGNSLAVRLPIDFVRRTHLRDGDTLTLVEAPNGTLTLVAKKPFDRAAFVARLREQSAKLKMGSSVVEEMRRDARY